MHGRSAALAARGRRHALVVGAVMAAVALGAPAAAESRSGAGTPTEPRGYHPIVASRGGETVVLTGGDLTADQPAAEFFAPLAKDIDAGP